MLAPYASNQLDVDLDLNCAESWRTKFDLRDVEFENIDEKMSWADSFDTTCSIDLPAESSWQGSSDWGDSFQIGDKLQDCPGWMHTFDDRQTLRAFDNVSSDYEESSDAFLADAQLGDQSTNSSLNGSDNTEPVLHIVAVDKSPQAKISTAGVTRQSCEQWYASSNFVDVVQPVAAMPSTFQANSEIFGRLLLVKSTFLDVRSISQENVQQCRKRRSQSADSVRNVTSKPIIATWDEQLGHPKCFDDTHQQTSHAAAIQQITPGSHDTTQQHYPCGACEKPRNSNDGDRTSLLVAYLPRNATNSDLMRIFCRFGTVSLVSVMRDADGTSKCFAFVNFEETEAACAALKMCEQGNVMLPDSTGKKWHLKASWAQRNGSRRDRRRRASPAYEEDSISVQTACTINESCQQTQQYPAATVRNELIHNSPDANQGFGQSTYQSSTCLLVSSLPRCATRTELLSTFGRFGKIVLTSVVKDKCYGFVTFKTPEAARDAMQRCEQGHVVMPDEAGKPWYVQASWAASNRPQRQRRHGWSNASSSNGFAGPSSSTDATHASHVTGVCHRDSASPPGVWLA